MRSRFRYLLAVFVLWVCLQPVAAQQAADSKNSPQIVQLFREVVAPASKSTVRVLCDGKDTALGTIVAADGWVLTKASDLTGKITCRMPDGKELAAEIKGVKDDYDVALLKVQAMGLTQVQWHDSKIAAVGRWVASAGPGSDPIAIGVVSVATRAYKLGDQPPKMASTKSGFLGVLLETGDGGAKISNLVKGGPAEKAGLKIGDIVTHVDKKKILDMESLINTVGRHKPGDEITLKLLRGKEALEMKATLAKRPPQMLGNPQDRMGSALSNRRGGFPLILQHDTVLRPTDCGGPLVDLDGKVVGINIARAGRVETYAIPAEAIRALLPDLMTGKSPPEEKK